LENLSSKIFNINMQKCEKCKSEYSETTDMTWITEKNNKLILICKVCNEKRVSQVNGKPD
jgi:hypothetical protein